MKNLEKRLYGFVNYQLTGIQKGIQFGHAAVKLGREISKSDDEELKEIWNDWVDNWQTFIILDGGTTNDNTLYPGTINQYYDKFIEAGIPCQRFREPDLGNQVTAFVFLADERVFNRKKYPDFEKKWYNLPFYNNWVKSIGGEKNLFLRNFLRDKKLAQ
jgi:hypothetical protein